jgi:hypothetical protein
VSCMFPMCRGRLPGRHDISGRLLAAARTRTALTKGEQRLLQYLNVAVL